MDALTRRRYNKHILLIYNYNSVNFVEYLSRFLRIFKNYSFYGIASCTNQSFNSKLDGCFPAWKYFRI